jgi:hypothetical protein
MSEGMDYRTIEVYNDLCCKVRDTFKRWKDREKIYFNLISLNFKPFLNETLEYKTNEEFWYYDTAKDSPNGRIVIFISWAEAFYRIYGMIYATKF